MKHSLSAAIITKNEEAKIERCLRSLAWVDEIIVIDAESTDQTVEICRMPNQPWSSKTTVINRRWSGFKDQRNYAMAAAKNDWILVLDADEACTPELAEKIKALLSQPDEPERRAYKVRRIEYFLNKPILYGIWNPSYQDRFFHRHGVYYVNDIHEYPIFPSTAGEIHEPILHSPDFNVEKLLEKMNKYTSIEARDRYLQGKRTNWFHLAFTFPALSFKNYIYYGAYKDGMHGFILSLIEGISRLVRHIKIWQITQTEKKSLRSD
jgi:glycosyltransferase involved in cell wall biosynthesis